MRRRRKPNANGAVRSSAEAVAIAKKHGVEVPSWVKITIDERVPADRFADYTLVRQGAAGNPGSVIQWSTIAPDGVVPVRLHPSVATSDEAIAAVIEHECYERSRIKRTLEGHGATASQLERMVNDKVANNLHHQAWDIADLRVIGMRAETAAEKLAVRERREAIVRRFDLMNFGDSQ